MVNLPQASAPCPRVLIVEDDPDQRELIEEVLRSYFSGSDGEAIVSVGSAAECLALELEGFDVVLLDYNLPDCEGLSLLKQILQRADLPVIFVTGENVTTTAVEAIRAGATDYMVKLGDYLFAIPILVEKNIRQHQIQQENRSLQGQLQASLEEIRVKNAQLEESLVKLERAAATDHLTGLSNRRHFGVMLDRTYSEAVRYNFDLSCLMLDLDNYKTLNDTLGHQMGDKILIITAQVIQANLRTSDLAARYGGDEFVLLLPHTSVDMAVTVGERIRKEMVQTCRQYLATDCGLGMSVGVASLRQHQPTRADDLVALADKALYIAKDAGRNCISVFGQQTVASKS